MQFSVFTGVLQVYMTLSANRNARFLPVATDQVDLPVGTTTLMRRNRCFYAERVIGFCQ